MHKIRLQFELQSDSSTALSKFVLSQHSSRMSSKIKALLIDWYKRCTNESIDVWMNFLTTSLNRTLICINASYGREMNRFHHCNYRNKYSVRTDSMITNNQSIKRMTKNSDHRSKTFVRLFVHSFFFWLFVCLGAFVLISIAKGRWTSATIIWRYRCLLIRFHLSVLHPSNDWIWQSMSLSSLDSDITKSLHQLAFNGLDEE